MLLLGVFLRPVLMLIGLLAGMVLSFVSFRLINYAFVDFMKDLFNTGGSTPTTVYGVAAAFARHSSPGFNMSMIFIFPIVLCIFAGIVYVVTTRCFMLTFLLPDNILRWIGGPQHTNEAQQMAQQLQQDAVSGPGQAISRATSSFGEMEQLGQGIGKAVGGQMDKSARNKKLNLNTGKPSSGNNSGGEGGANPPSGGGGGAA